MPHKPPRVPLGLFWTRCLSPRFPNEETPDAQREEAGSLKSQRHPERARARPSPFSWWVPLPTLGVHSGGGQLLPSHRPLLSMALWAREGAPKLAGKPGPQGPGFPGSRAPRGCSQRLTVCHSSPLALPCPESGPSSATAEDLAVGDSDCVGVNSEAGEQRDPLLPM